MAQGFLVCVAPDAHIDYLAQHPGLVHAYLDGAPAPAPAPPWWPSEPPQMLDSWGINHRNTDLYHWILNGGPGHVSDAGAIFQSWHAPDHPASFVKLDAYNERFALHAAQLPELAAKVRKVDLEAVMRAFVDWCKAQGKTWEDIDRYACEPFVDEFAALGEQLAAAIRDGHGIIW